MYLVCCYANTRIPDILDYFCKDRIFRVSRLRFSFLNLSLIILGCCVKWMVLLPFDFETVEKLHQYVELVQSFSSVKFLARAYYNFLFHFAFRMNICIVSHSTGRFSFQ